MSSLIASLVPDSVLFPEDWLQRRYDNLTIQLRPYERMLRQGGLAGATAESYLQLDREREDVSVCLEALSEGVWV